MFGGVHPVSATDTSTAGLMAHLLLYFWASNFHDQGAHRGRMKCICRSVSDFGHQVREARASIALRRSFMEALFPFFGRPLEADAVGPFVTINLYRQEGGVNSQIVYIVSSSHCHWTSKRFLEQVKNSFQQGYCCQNMCHEVLSILLQILYQPSGRQLQ